MNNVIKKKNKVKEKILVDDFLTQLQNEQEAIVEESPPIEITDKVKEKMMKLMETYLICKDKTTKLNAIKKEITSQMNTSSRDLTTLMKFYGLNELIIKDKKFVLEQNPKKVPLKKDEFRQVLATYIGDAKKVDEIYGAADEACEMRLVEKLKCLKYKG